MIFVRYSRPLLIAVLLLSLGSPVYADLTAEGHAFADNLVRAGWTGGAAADFVSTTCRIAPLFSAAGQNAVSHASELSDSEQKALKEVARVDLTARAYFSGRVLSPGSYRLGLSIDAHGAMAFELRKADSEEILGISGCWVRGSFDDNPRVSAVGASGNVTIHIHYGSLDLEFFFVRASAVEALAEGFETHSSGAVRILTKLPWNAGVESLAGEAAARVGEFFGELGADAVGVHRVLVFTEWSEYQRASQLVANGGYQEHGAFSSYNTGESYIYFPACSEQLLYKGRVPLWLRAIVLHEIHHLVIFRVYPRTFSFWPEWFSEGLCEVGTELGLRPASTKDAECFRAIRLGSLRDARLREATPSAEDIYAWQPGGDLLSIYAAAYEMMRTVRKDRKLSSLMRSDLRRGGGPEVLGLRLQERIAAAQGSTSKFVEDALREGSERVRHGAWKSGHYDRVGKDWHRVYSSKSGAAKVIFPKVHIRGEVRVSGESTFLPDGTTQADIYFGYRGGARSERFLKLAVLPKKVVLFRYTTANGWSNLGAVDFDTALKVGTADKPAWHRWTVTATKDGKSVRWQTDKGRWAEFNVDDPTPMEDTRYGIGVYGGMAYFRNLKLGQGL